MASEETTPSAEVSTSAPGGTLPAKKSHGKGGVPVHQRLVKAAHAALAGNASLRHAMEQRVAEITDAYSTGEPLSPMMLARIEDVVLLEFFQSTLTGWLAKRKRLTVGPRGHQSPTPVLHELRSLIKLKTSLVDSMGLGFAVRAPKSLDAYMEQASREAQEALDALKAPTDPEDGAGLGDF